MCPCVKDIWRKTEGEAKAAAGKAQVKEAMSARPNISEISQKTWTWLWRLASGILGTEAFVLVHHSCSSRSHRGFSFTGSWRALDKTEHISAQTFQLLTSQE